MNAWRIITVVVGLFFFVAVAVLDGVIAGAASSIRPLVLL